MIGADAADLAGEDSFAGYLAKVFVAKKGYQPGTVPEAQLLATASDYVVTKSDFALSIICIVDASKDATRHFGLDRSSVIEIAKVCRKAYGGGMGRRRPVLIEIVEVHDRVSPSDIARTKPMVSRFRYIIGAYLVDLTERKVHSNFWAIYNARGRMIEKLLRRPRMDATALVPPPALVAPEAKRFPILTLLMLAVLVGIFAFEVNFAPPEPRGLMEPTLTTLIALGGLMRQLVVERHEWYRLFTGPLLHASLEHILFNGIALWLSASFLERLLGRAWLLVLFVSGALGGAVVSMAINPPQLVSVGASGAIMCLIAAAWLTSYRTPGGSKRIAIQMRMARMLIPSLIPLFASGSSNIDYGAHFGGAITGFGIGGILLATWRRSEAAPRFAPIARVLAAASVLALAGAGYEAYATRNTYALAAELIPDNQIPDTDAEIAKKTTEFLKDYPNDPRSHFFRAVTIMDEDPTAAERELRIALSEKQVLETQFKPEFEVTLVSYLARVLATEGRAGEARLAVKPYCHRGPNGTVPKDLQPLGLCEGQ